MAQKIVYFTADVQPTSNENADIEKLKLACEPQYELVIASKVVDPLYSAGRPIDCDFVAAENGEAGIPAAYSEVDVLDPDDIPVNLESTQAIVTNAEEFTVTAGKVTAAVSDSEATMTFAPAATKAVISTGDTWEIAGGTLSVTIAANVPTFVFTPE